MSQHKKAERFNDLHQREGAFVIPNPWDAGSAKLMTGLGFEALATTSSGYANSIGLADGGLSLEQKIAHCRDLVAVTDLPINADLENCFAHDPASAAKTILLAAEAGIVGASIEDYSGDPDQPIYDFDHAVERVQAVVEAANSLDFPFMLTARAEGLLHKAKDMDDTIARLQAFEAVGAHVLYAPALRTLDEVRAITSEVARPVNVLAPPVKGATVSQLADAGAKRISIGGALNRAVTATLLAGAREMLDDGGFSWTASAAPSGEIERLLGQN